MDRLLLMTKRLTVDQQKALRRVATSFLGKACRHEPTPKEIDDLYARLCLLDPEALDILIDAD